MSEETIYQHLRREGVTRRDFVKLCGLLAGAMGLNSLPPLKASALPLGLGEGSNPADMVARAFASKPRVPVLWLEFQDCAGCSEALTRSQSPTLIDLVLSKISVEYHETLSAASGFQLEENKTEIMKKLKQ